MKKRLSFLFLALLGIVLGTSASFARETGDTSGFVESEGYTYGFEDLKNSVGIGYLSQGWNYASSGTPTTYFFSRSTTKHAGSYALYAANKSSASTIDYMITPALKGTISFWAKAYSSSSSYASAQYVKFYSVTPNGDGSFSAPSEDNLIEKVELGNNTSWTQYTLSTKLEDYAYVAFTSSYCYMDDLAADYALMPENPGLQVTAFNTDWNDTNALYADHDGKATFTGAIKVKNVGNVKLAAGRQDYSVTISTTSSTVTIPETIIPIPVDLAVGEESAEIPVSIECTIADLASGDARTALKATSNLLLFGTTATTTGNYKQTTGDNGGYFTVKSPAPKLEVRNFKSDKMAEYATELGLADAPATTTVLLRSLGGSPVVLKNIVTTCEGVEFSIDGEALTFPYSLNNGLEQNVTMTFTKTGGQATTLDFVYGNNYDDSEYHYVTKAVSAVVKDASLYFEDFDSYLTVPAGWCQPGWINQEGSNWSFDSSSQNTYAKNSRQEYPNAKLVTPKLTIAEGQTLTIAAQPEGTPGSNSYDCYVKVYYSADRQNWTLGGYIGYVNSSNVATKASAEGVDASLVKGWTVTSGTGNLNSSYCKAYVIDGIPAGDWYIGFQSGYSIIDYVFGGQLATLDNDLYVEELQVEATPAMVNYPVKATVKYTNMLDKAAPARTVALYNGETLIEEKDGAELDAYAAETVEFTFTPREAAEMNLKVVITNVDDEYEVATAPVALTIAEEVMASEVLVGTRTSSSTSNIPLALNWYNARGEWIWTADKLGLESGKDITSITFYYYNTGKDLPHKNVKIYLVNTDETVVAAVKTDVSGLTPVYSNDDYTFKMAGTSANHAEMKFILDTPFTYTGGNIKAIITSEDEAKGSYSSYSFEYYTANTGSSNYVRNDTYSSYLTGSASTSTQVPVATLGYAAVAPTFTGAVTADGNAVEGAKVTAVSDNVEYHATTDAEGKYEMSIFQPEKEYTIVVDGVYGYDKAEVAASAEGNTIALVQHTVAIPETVNTYKYTTLYDSKFDMAIPAGVKAYVAESLDGGQLVYTEITDYIPANTGVLLYAPEAIADLKAKALTEKPEEKAEYSSLFFGYDEATTPEAEAGYSYYKLQYSPDEDRVAFYLGAPDGGVFECKANRAYLMINTALSAPKSLSLPADDATAISTIQNAERRMQNYNLNGVRVNDNYKGIVIKNGKKVMVK